MKTRMVLVTVLSVLLAIVSVSALSAQNTASADSAPACTANFTEDGNFWTGKTFKSFQEFPKLDRDKAFTSVAQQVAADGWQGLNAQKDIGVITAVQTVNHGRGKQAPLNVVFRALENGGIRIEVVFVTSSGLKVDTKDMQDEFCKLLGAATK